MNETYEEYMNRKLLESIQYKPKEEPTKVTLYGGGTVLDFHDGSPLQFIGLEEEPTKLTLYADDKPYQVIDLKDIDDMSEEEYNDKLKDAWLKETTYKTYKTIEELTLSKYYNYEVEEQEEKPKDETDWRSVIFGVLYWGIPIGVLIFAIVKVINGG